LSIPNVRYQTEREYSRVSSLLWNPMTRHLSVVDNSSTHHLPGLHSLFDLPETMDLRGANALDMERQIAELNRKYPWVDTLRLRTPEDIRSASRRIEFFNFDLPPELIEATEFTWLSIPGGYRLPLPGGAWISVESNLLDSWDISHVRHRVVTPVGRERTPSDAVGVADAFVRDMLPDTQTLLRRSARWRGERPTAKQTAMLSRNGLPAPDGLTRGQASQMIAWGTLRGAS